MSRLTPIVALLLAGIVMFSCEEEFTPPVVNASQQVVVEGYIEGGDQPTPPYLILTRSFPFFSSFGPDQYNALFVHDADVRVSDGEREVQLTELCLDNIPEALREQAQLLFGVDPDSIAVNLCVYIDLSFSMLGQEGKTYTLQINTTEGEQLSASTTVPYGIPLDSLWFTQPPGEPSEIYAQCRAFVKDPAGQTDYYRYFTAENDGPFQRPFTSVTDDAFFDGQSFEFPITKAEPFDGEFDQESFGLFIQGDTAHIKWMTIDADQFAFWNTLEFSRANQGPFSSYTRINHNITGGLGIWGGVAARYYSQLVEIK